MKASRDDLPPAMSSLWRTFKLGYHAEPKLLTASLLAVVVGAIPDVLVAVWLKVMSDAVLDGRSTVVVVAGVLLGVCAAATWVVRVLTTRIERRFRDRVSIALESHVAQLHASVATIEHTERADYMDRLSVLRDQVFALDHLFMSVFSTLGWILRLVFTISLLASISPVLILLVLFAIPTVFSSTHRPAVEREVEESVASRMRLARHLFVLGTTAPPAKEVRVTNTGDWLVTERRAAWERWYGPVAKVGWSSAAWHSLAWAVFAGAYVAAVVYVATGLDRGVGDVVLVLAAGNRLARYVGATAGELGFLRGFWLDSSRRLTWLEDYAAGIDASATASAPDRLVDGIAFDH